MAEMTSEITELLAQAMRAIQYGHKPAAAAYLNRILELDPDNMDAWRWLSECMPNQSKRDYCLERAGLASSTFQSHSVAFDRSSDTVNLTSVNDFFDEPGEPTLAEKHAVKATLRGQKRAELPPHYHTALPINIEYPKATVNNRRSQSTSRKPQNSSGENNRRPSRRSRRIISLKGLGLSVLVIAVSVISGYVFFSTGLTTGSKVLDWISLQIENNTSDLSLFGDKPSPTPQSPFDQPAEESSILATYFPEPEATPQPAENENSDVSGTVQENNARVSAEVPETDGSGIESSEETVVEEASAVEESSTAEEASVVEDSSEVEASAETVNLESAAPTEPTGYVDGPIVIGQSVKGNYIEVIQFGNGPVERMMVAGIHGGNEWNTTALADQLIAYLYKNPQAIPGDRTLYILRLLNPDGEAKGHNLDGRTNERGVDLNRNWDAFWVIDWPRDGCWNYRPISAGSSPFSEPETIALRDFLQAHKISGLINYHSAALGIFAGGRPPEAESVRLAQSISAVTNYAYPPADTGCKYTGQFADWLTMNGTAAVDLELANHTDTDFDENLKVLDVLLKWEPSNGAKSLTGLINMAKNIPEKPTLMQKIGKYSVQALNTLNGLIFGRQEEK